MTHRLYLSPPHMCGRERDFVSAVFDANWIAPAGPDITAFEQAVCEYTGTPHAAALVSGTAALHLALIVSGVQHGDIVYCSDLTFAGTVNPVCHLGAEPHFVDSDTASWNMDPELLREAIRSDRAKGKSPKACIVVHLYGMCADMDAIMAVCRDEGIVCIEDAAESLGATWRGEQTGTIGDLGIYSFNGNKIITTSGGGMLVGKNGEQIERARYLSQQARQPLPWYEHVDIGYNYRMSNVVAAIGRGQMTVIDERVHRRRAVYEAYVERLSAVAAISFMPELSSSRGNRWLTVILIDPEKAGGITTHDVREALEAENIESRPLWKPMHMQPVFSGVPVAGGAMGERLFECGLCLPSGTAMSNPDIDRVCAVIHSLLPNR